MWSSYSKKLLEFIEALRLLEKLYGKDTLWFEGCSLAPF